MAKVLIYEDSELDAVNRYGRLTVDHDVHLRIQPLLFGEPDMRALEKAGFNPENIKKGFGDIGQATADVYFVDGLEGQYKRIMEQLPLEKAFLNSGSPSLVKATKEQGFQVLEGTLEEAISMAMRSAGK